MILDKRITLSVFYQKSETSARSVAGYKGTLKVFHKK